MRTTVIILATAIIGCSKPSALNGPLASAADSAGLRSKVSCDTSTLSPDARGGYAAGRPPFRDCRAVSADTTVRYTIDSGGKVLAIGKTWLPSDPGGEFSVMKSRLVEQLGAARECPPNDQQSTDLVWDQTGYHVRLQLAGKNLTVSRELGASYCHVA